MSKSKEQHTSADNGGKLKQTPGFVERSSIPPASSGTPMPEVKPPKKEELSRK